MEDNLNPDNVFGMGSSDPAFASPADDNSVLNNNGDDYLDEDLEGQEDLEEDLEGQKGSENAEDEDPEGEEGNKRKPPKHVPYHALQNSRKQLRTEREEKEYWKQMAMKSQPQSQTQPQQFVYKTPEELQREKEIQAYQTRLRELGVPMTEDVKKETEELKSQIEELKKVQEEERTTRAVERTRQRIESEAATLSKKFDGSNGLKFDFGKFQKQAQKDPKAMAMLRSGVEMETVFMILNKEAYISAMAKTKTQPEPTPKSRADMGGKVNTDNMSAEEVARLIDAKNGRA